MRQRLTQSGLGLVEIMIGVALGLVLLLALYSLLVSNRQTYSSVQTSSELIKNSQQITQLITTLLQQAGFRNYERLKRGELLPSESTSLVDIDISWQEKQAVFISDDVTNSDTTEAKEGTDVLQIHFVGSRNVDSISASVIEDMPSGSAPALDAADGTIINCSGDAIDNSSVALALYVSTDNQLMCIDSVNQRAIVVANDVEDLQIRVKTQTGSTAYELPSAVTDWTTISNLEVGFLLSKPYDNGLPVTATTYRLPGKDVTVTNDDEHKIRQAFTSNVMIKNYLFQ